MILRSLLFLVTTAGLTADDAGSRQNPPAGTSPPAPTVPANTERAAPARDTTQERPQQDIAKPSAPPPEPAKRPPPAAPTPAAETARARELTREILDAVQAGLGIYNEKQGEFPETANPATSAVIDGRRVPIGHAMMLYQAMTGDGDDAIKILEGTRSASDGKVSEDEAEYAAVQRLPPGAIKRLKDGRHLLVDGFGSPLQYRKKPLNGAGEVFAEEER